MTKRRNNQKKPKRRNAVHRVEASQLSALQTIKENTASMQRGIMPKVPDVQRIYFSQKDRVYTFSRKYVGTPITPSTTVDQAGALNFQLTNFPDATEFTSLFDQYRIVQITVEFLSLTTGPYVSPLTSIIDYDDSNAVASLNELLEYQTAMTTTAGANHTRTLTPHVTSAVYSGAFTSFAVAPNSLWIDCANANVQYYGLKYYFPALSGGTNTVLYNVYISGILQFKRVR